MRPTRVVFAGCGFLGEAAAVLLLRGGARVLGLTATPESAARLRQIGLDAEAVDLSRPFDLPAEWTGADCLIHAASSRRGGPDAYRAVYRDGLRHALDAVRPERVIFTGSTSVYGQCDGAWVIETSPTEPDRETGRILLEAEALALAEPRGFVARLAGLYGPGRSVLLQKVIEGTAVLEEGGHRWINQIHRDDAARALVHLATADAEPGLYNVCDDTPATQRMVYEWITSLLGRPMPPEGPADRNRKRGWTSKRVSNAKLRVTGWAPDFPSYREAVPSLAAHWDATQRA